MQDRAAPLGTRDRDVSKAAFFLEAGQATFVDRALAGKDAFFPTGQEDMVEFETLRRMHGHDGDLLAIVGAVVIHHKTDMFEEIAERFVFLHGARQFGQVFQPPRAFRAAILLQHVLVAALGEHHAQQFGRRYLFGFLAPAHELAEQSDKVVARAGGKLVGSAQVEAGCGQWHLHLPGMAAHCLQRLGAETALGLVVDTLESKVVGRLRDGAQISERIADFSALVEAISADDAIVEPDLDEAVLEFARLVLRAHQDGDLVERGTLAFEPFDVFADAAGLFRGIPDADYADLFACGQLGPKGLSQPLAIGADQSGCGGEDLRCRAVVLL